MCLGAAPEVQAPSPVSAAVGLVSLAFAANASRGAKNFRTSESNSRGVIAVNPHGPLAEQ